MGATARKVVDIREAARTSILDRAMALGNSKKGLKEVASDLLNREGKRSMQAMMDGTFLSRGTLDRVMDADEYYRPQAETLERIFRYFNAEITFNEVKISGRYQNKAKEW